MTVRHFTEADIPIRTELLRENKYQTNLNDFAMSADDRALADGMQHTIDAQHHVKRLFTMCGSKGQVVGFSWITSIDWRSQACELSFAVLPRYRSGFGFKAVEAAHEYLREQLHMDVIINQVLSHNTMMLSAAELEANAQVRSEFDSYTVGQWRTACYWTVTRDEVRDRKQREMARRQEIADRVRAGVRELS
ncbi:GNAT family N-acetyltransferase [Kutzneria chonburiensis]|uniref:GNAT family N-acetyltransferase n=1 Tax=Kutzneria chonburiensis TaxID=1483604 RepID=A0ABV6MLN1_9PSEU|nr:GNAT family N-acetyltransferase [Kutzneria chonburiensis]